MSTHSHTRTKADSQHYTVEWVVSALVWLDDWPVGLKLNTPLSRFFRVSFSMLIESWGGESNLRRIITDPIAIIHPVLQVHLPSLLHIMSLSGYGGFTLFLSLARDTLALLTLHLRICHEIMSLLVRWQLSSLGGLWNLFRGKVMPSLSTY
jgi:phosphatidylinositol glycan class Q protein